MAPGPIVEVPPSTDITVTRRTEIEFVPKVDLDVTLPGLDGFQLGGGNPLEGSNGQNFGGGTLKLFSEPSSTIPLAPSSSGLRSGGVLGGLSLFLGGCSLVGSPLVSIVPALVLGVSVAAVVLGRIFLKSAPKPGTGEAPPFGRHENSVELSTDEIDLAEALLLGEPVPEDVQALRATSEWTWAEGVIRNPDYGPDYLENGLLGNVATGGSLVTALQDPDLSKTLDALALKSDGLAKDAREFSDKSKIFQERYESWENELKEYGKLSKDDPGKALALADVYTRWLTQVKPAIEDLQGTNYYKTHAAYDEAVHNAETTEIHKIGVALSTFKAQAAAEGSTVDFRIEFKKPEDLPFESDAIKNLPASDLVMIEVTAPTKAKLLKIEESLKKQGLLPGPVAVVFKTGDTESTWLPESAAKPVPKIGFIPMMSGKRN